MSRINIQLNSNWMYYEDFRQEYIDQKFKDNGFCTVNLPHANKIIPYNYFDEKMYQFISCYKKNIRFSENYKNKRILIDFEGVMAYARVYLNGTFVGEHKGGYTPFSFDITGLIEFDKENVLAVMVDSSERNDIPPFGNAVDYLTYGGIYRDVGLRVVGNIYIDNVFVKTLDVLKENKKVKNIVYLKNTTGASGEVFLNAILKDGEEIVSQKCLSIRLDGNPENEFEIGLDDLSGIKIWDIEDPKLYKMLITINDNGYGISDNYEVSVGFRDVCIKNNGFYLNGNKVKIRGLNRHQSFPYVGYAMPERVQKKDADILKNDLHINTVRTSHYPQSRYFLDRCDEIGLLVLEEIPGWNFIGDDEWKKVAVRNVEEMIKRDWNHPSIFLWGVRINESIDDHDFYAETNNIAHMLDDTRQTGGIRCYEKGEFLEDVYTMNDFVYDGGDVILREQKIVTGLLEDVPYMVTEFNGHMYPAKRFDQEERLLEHAMRHARVQNAAASYKNMAGAIGWCAFDYNTHYNFGSGDRICYHGVMDMFRISKAAANFYKSQVDINKEIVLEPATIWAFGERNTGGVLPLVIFTNCDFIEFHMGKRLIGRYFPDRENFKNLEYPPVVIRQMPSIWVTDWDDGIFSGYYKEQKVKEKIFCKNPIAKELTGSADDTVLSGDGRDATRIVYKVIDQAGNVIPFINEFIKFNISGPGEIIGPDETALIGGCIALWVKSKNERGIIRLSAFCSRFISGEILITVN